MSNSVSACCHALIRVVSAPSESFLFCHKCGEACRVKGEEMSEEKPLPCAFCRVVPNVNETDDFWDKPVVERWAEKGCFVCHQFTGYPIAAWNDDQKKLLELRRKDFEAGEISGGRKCGRVTR